ncbi:MAG TPA: winged helix-turn-helix domain-containing protein [Vicinamibacterales bacterium]|nr:winged helix-turn-helix domain-containing protein [Vicinamibacterales bacterium]
MDTSNPLRFGTFELDLRARELRNGSTRIRLQEQPFEILRLMLERPGDVVTRDELRQRLWPDGTFVDFEHSLNAAIKRLRAALGDDADRPTFIETVPRRGYRFIAATPDAHVLAKTTASPALPRVRLVVLPFSNLSDDSSQEYFSDGLTEELIAQLGPLCRGQVGVIARWSSMFFKGSLQRAREIGETLNADYLLEGSTRRDGARVRITARLVEASSEAHLWSETYDRTTEDWLSVQADVASRVARSLMRELVPPAPRGVAPHEPPSAYQAYLKGRYHWAKPGDEGLEMALECLGEAVRIAPDFAAAQGALARMRVAAAEYYHQVPRLALVSAREAATRALELDPTVSEAQAALADVERMLDMDWKAAEAGYSRALVLNPSNEAALRSFGLTLALQDRHVEATSQIDQARELDPLCLATGTQEAWMHYLAGDYEGSIASAARIISIDPEFVYARRVQAAALLQLGRNDEAVAQLEFALTITGSHAVLLTWLAHAKAVTGARTEALALLARACALEGTQYVPPFHMALAHTGLGSLDAAFAALDQAWLDRDPSLGSLSAEPRFEPLRKDARYIELISRLNLPASRVAAGSR